MMRQKNDRRRSNRLPIGMSTSEPGRKAFLNTRAHMKPQHLKWRRLSEAWPRIMKSPLSAKIALEYENVYALAARPLVIVRH